YQAASDGGIQFNISKNYKLNIGEHVCISLRPEKLVFIEDEEMRTGWTVIDGVVKEFIYLGDLRHYEVAISQSDLFLIQIASIPGVEHWKRGRKVKVGWKWDDIKLV
ncbi:MAG: TOBE domain-containing protein, partial [Spirochaetota bacterium]